MEVDAAAVNQEAEAGDAGESTGQSSPAPVGTGEPTTTEIPRFFAVPKEAPAEDELEHIDPAKLPPELQKTYKQIQAAATRKFQAAADLRKQAEQERRNLLDEREKWLERIADRAPRTGEETPSDPLAKVRELREAGEVDEADRLLVEISERRAEERLRPLEQQAKLSTLKAQFRDVVSDAMTMPIVLTYKDAVQAVFDSKNPDITAFREMIFEKPERVGMVKPLLYLLACEQGLMNLEKNYGAAVKAGVKAALAKEVSLATGSPTKLVPGSTTSRETTPGRESDIRKAMNLAKTQLGI